ncbi:MAG: helix-turn-helix domain-containing protein [Pirellula sp.]
MSIVLEDTILSQERVSIANQGDNVSATRALHRIAEVREQQGLSLQSLSRRMGLDVRELKQQEQSDSNLTLRELYCWQKALDVPVQHLLCEEEDGLSETTQTRAALVKLMKTVVALTEVATAPRVVRLTTMLREQMIDMMPELAEIGGWPNYGSRRPTDQLGRIGENPIDVSSLNIE